MREGIDCYASVSGNRGLNKLLKVRILHRKTRSSSLIVATNITFSLQEAFANLPKDGRTSYETSRRARRKLKSLRINNTCHTM